MPHAWLLKDRQKVSTHDLARFGEFTLFTGISGQAWADAVSVVAAELGIPLSAVVIGPGQEVTDLYNDWERLSQVEEDGAVLVRPDKHVAFRSHGMVDDPAAVLRDALTGILARA